MQCYSTVPFVPARRFGMRDAWAYARALPRLAGAHRPNLSFTALARISAMDVKKLPPIQRFSASDGKALAFRTYPGPNHCHLILVHGSACFGDQLNFLASELSRSGKATVHTLDMRGHGQSPPVGRDHERFVRDLSEFATLLRDLPGEPTVVVGGHSAGGGLAANLARSAYGSAISGWLFFAPFLRIDSNSVRPFFGGWLSNIRRLPLALIASANLLGITRFNNRVVAGFNRDAFLHDPRFAREWSFASAFGFGPGPIPDRMHERIPAEEPVLLISGDQDECFVPEHYPEALAAIAPHGEVRILGGLGHWDILVDRGALQLCCDWFDQHFPASTFASTEHFQAASG